MKNLIFFLLITSLAIFSSCKGDRGNPGPIGVMGTDGADGLNGQIGQDGQDGLDGQDGQHFHTPVKSVIINVNSSDWMDLSSTINFVDLQVPNIDLEIYGRGVIAVYANFSNTPGNWINIPSSFSNQYYSTGIDVGKVQIQSFNEVEPPAAPSCQIKVVTIPADGLVRNPNLDLTDYEAVKTAFNLPD